MVSTQAQHMSSGSRVEALEHWHLSACGDGREKVIACSSIGQTHILLIIIIYIDPGVTFCQNPSNPLSTLWLYPRFSEHSESDRNLGIPFRIRSDSECEFLNGISFVLGKNSPALGMAPECRCAAPPRL